MQLMSQKYWCELDEKRKHSKTYDKLWHIQMSSTQLQIQEIIRFPIQVDFENKPWIITLNKAYLLIIDSAMSNGMWTKVYVLS